MSIIFRFYGKFERIDSNQEINGYRIIQELVNNSIKHSGADELVVQMLQEPNRLCFIVADNGKGFDLKDIGKKQSVGLNSIKSRVTSFNGQWEINSNIGKGTEVMVEFML
jgi:signal transduction histidine kinase